MNDTSDLRAQRVQRINPLSIFFLMQAMMSLAGGFCAGLLTVFLAHWGDPAPALVSRFSSATFTASRRRSAPRCASMSL